MCVLVGVPKYNMANAGERIPGSEYHVSRFFVSGRMVPFVEGGIPHEETCQKKALRLASGSGKPQAGSTEMHHVSVRTNH